MPDQFTANQPADSEPDLGPQPVEVFQTRQESEAMVVQGLLTTASIPSVIANLEAPQDVLPGVGGVAILVPAERADEAMQLIEEYRNAPAAEEVEDES